MKKVDLFFAAKGKTKKKKAKPAKTTSKKRGKAVSIALEPKKGSKGKKASAKAPKAKGPGWAKVRGAVKRARAKESPIKSKVKGDAIKRVVTKLQNQKVVNEISKARDAKIKAKVAAHGYKKSGQSATKATAKHTSGGGKPALHITSEQLKEQLKKGGSFVDAARRAAGVDQKTGVSNTRARKQSNARRQRFKQAVKSAGPKDKRQEAAKQRAVRNVIDKKRKQKEMGKSSERVAKLKGLHSKVKAAKEKKSQPAQPMPMSEQKMKEKARSRALSKLRIAHSTIKRAMGRGDGIGKSVRSERGLHARKTERNARKVAHLAHSRYGRHAQIARQIGKEHLANKLESKKKAMVNRGLGKVISRKGKAVATTKGVLRGVAQRGIQAARVAHHVGKGVAKGAKVFVRQEKKKKYSGWGKGARAARKSIFGFNA